MLVGQQEMFKYAPTIWFEYGSQNTFFSFVI